MDVSLAKGLPADTNPIELWITAANEPFIIPAAPNPIKPRINPNILFMILKIKFLIYSKFLFLFIC